MGGDIIWHMRILLSAQWGPAPTWQRWLTGIIKAGTAGIVFGGDEEEEEEAPMRDRGAARLMDMCRNTFADKERSFLTSQTQFISYRRHFSRPQRSRCDAHLFIDHKRANHSLTFPRVA